MGWDRGRYYTRSRKVNGRVIREYVGTGSVGELAAQVDQIHRARRAAERAAVRELKAELETLDADIEALCELADLTAHAALVAAGYHQHKRGEWRKRHGNRTPAECAGGSHGPEGTAQDPGARPER